MRFTCATTGMAPGTLSEPTGVSYARGGALFHRISSVTEPPRGLVLAASCAGAPVPPEVVKFRRPAPRALALHVLRGVAAAAYLVADDASRWTPARVG